MQKNTTTKHLNNLKTKNLEVTMSNKKQKREDIVFNIILPIISVLLSFGFISLIVWVIVHFIIKFW